MQPTRVTTFHAHRARKGRPEKAAYQLPVKGVCRTGVRRTIRSPKLIEYYVTQAIPHTIKIHLKHAELSIPTRDDERPELQLKGQIVNSLRIVVTSDDTDISTFAAEVSIVCDREVRDHVGSVWVDLKARTLNAAVYAGNQSFDRIVAQLSGSAPMVHLYLGVPGLRHTDENGGTLEWEAQTARSGESLISADLSAQLR
ncbi:hypothetical protein D3C81_506010 [compost metagenome]